MFNQYVPLTEENADIIMANTVIENLKFIIVSLDTVFKGGRDSIHEDFFDEDFTFYFYHLQNALTSCGNITNVFNRLGRTNEQVVARTQHLCETFDINIDSYPTLFRSSKAVRNANEHFDERYDYFSGRVGDYNVISASTYVATINEIYNSPHIRTLDKRNWTYITYRDNRNNPERPPQRIICDLQALRDEAYNLLEKISNHPRVSSSSLQHIPTREMI